MVEEFLNKAVNAPSLSQLLENIEKLAPKVNAAAQKADFFISAVERRLANAGVTTACSRIINLIDIPAGYDFEPNTFTDAMTEEQRSSAGVKRSLGLSYRRHGDQFRIVLWEGVHWCGKNERDQFEVTFEKPLLECSAGKKLHCIHLIGDLVLQIAEKMKAQADAADMIISKAPMLTETPPAQEPMRVAPDKVPEIPREPGVKINVWRGVHNEKDWITISRDDHRRIQELLENSQRGHAAIMLARLANLPMNYARETLGHEKSFADVKPKP